MFVWFMLSGLLPIKQYYRMLWQTHVRPHVPSSPSFAHGAVPGRRREEAIAIQSIMAFRLRTAGISTAVTLYDVRNAFPSPSFSCIRAFFADVPASLGRDLLQAHVLQHVCKLRACDGTLLLQPGSGIPQGSTIATDCFNQIYWSAVRKYEHELETHTAMLLAPSPSTGMPVSVAHTLFVDDLASEQPAHATMFWHKLCNVAPMPSMVC